VVAASAQFLKTDVTLLRERPHRGRECAVVASHFLVLLFEVNVLNGLAVEHYFEVLASDGNVALIPLGRLVACLVGATAR
jgi:hypothetical protein